MALQLISLVSGGILGVGYATDWSFKLQEKKTSSSSSSSKSQTGKVDYTQVREDIKKILFKDGYDDGHIGPVLVRLAWHASGTYDKTSKTGGSNGATMRFPTEMKDGANAGLNQAQAFLEEIKKQHPGLSYADLWILASYVAIEEMEGPQIPFTPGRTDATSQSACPPNGRLPDATQNASHIRDVFYRMGFSDREIVALIGGGHAIGRCHKDRSGFDGPWTTLPTTFTNRFFIELFGNDWKPRQWDGPQQFEDGQKKNLMMLPTDLEIQNDQDFSKWAQIYKDDDAAFQRDFADAFQQLTELGFVNNF